MSAPTRLGRLVAASAVLAAVAGCSSGGADPSPPPPPSSSAAPPAATSTLSSTPASTPESSTPASSTPTASTGPATLCPTAGDATALTTCLTESLDAYWSDQLDDDVTQRVVLRPEAAAVPAQCRRALTTAPAFTCPVDRTVYLTDDFVASLQSAYQGVDRRYAFAAVLGHEVGHIVQLLVHQPQIEDDDPDTNTFVEQQADCLSGVWAHASTLALDPAEFRSVARRVLTAISTPREIATHGTPAERVAAIDRGLHGSGPAACELRTFA